MARFSVLASGSSGNAAFLEMGGFGLLIDIGLGPRLLASRLASLGASWKNVHAALLTHVHTDHWKDRTLATLCSRNIPLYCHPAHTEVLSFYGPSFAALKKAGLVRSFADETPFDFNGATCLPIQIPHDSEPTFAFRINGTFGLFSDEWAVGYAADLGAVPGRLLELFRDVHLLALEFNHDEEMEKRSGRPRHLIDRVLGDRGHLSNRQAAESLRTLLRDSKSGNLKQLVQLHLSHECNRPALAQAAAKKALAECEKRIVVHTASQDRSTKFIDLLPW